MSINWLKRLTETPEEKTIREETARVELKRSLETLEETATRKEMERRALESPEERESREAGERHAQLEELKSSDEFRDIVGNAFQKLKDKEQQDIDDEKLAHDERVDKAKLDVELVGESMQDSLEPFANVLAMGFSKEHGIQVKIDFNPAFIRYLKTFGIVGNNDEETIRIWLAHMADDIMNTERAEDYLYNGVDKEEKPTLSYEEMFQTDEEEEENDEESDNRWEQPTS